MRMVVVVVHRQRRPHCLPEIWMLTAAHLAARHFGAMLLLRHRCAPWLPWPQEREMMSPR